MHKYVKKIALMMALAVLSAASYASQAHASGQSGVCGADHNSATFSSAPTNKARLCARGVASTATLSGSNWVWTCAGSGTGSTASCYTAYCSIAIDGSCGSANGGQLMTAPTGSELCAYGTASPVAGIGPWTWTCAGTSGGATVSCSAQTCNAATTPINGYCGGADGQYFAAAAEANAAGLCNPGNPSPASVSGSGPWNWTCVGSNGGGNANCSAGVASTINGQCRPYGATYATQPATGTASGCSSGSYADATDTGSHWVWRCNGTGSPAGYNVTCSAAKQTVVNGQCVTFSGQFASQPASNTASGCVSGTFSEVGDSSSEWKWDCVGSGGGVISSCSASKIPLINGSCKTFSSTYESQPATDTPTGCATGTYADVADTGSEWRWACNGQGGGTNATCAATVRAVGCTLGPEFIFNDWDGWAGDMALAGPYNLCQGSNYIATEFGGTGSMANLRGTCGSNTDGYFNTNGGACLTRVTANCGNNLNCATNCQIYARDCQ